MNLYLTMSSVLRTIFFTLNCDGKICEKEPRDNETSLYRTNFANPLAPRYTEVPLYKETPRRSF